MPHCLAACMHAQGLAQKQPETCVYLEEKEQEKRAKKSPSYLLSAALPQQQWLLPSQQEAGHLRITGGRFYESRSEEEARHR